jgi:putative ABC transport system permease protein
VGRAVQLDGQAHVVVGVAPKGFMFPDGAQIWRPLAFSAEDAADRDGRALTVFGHLKPGRSESDARGELTAIYARLKEQYPDAFRGGLFLKVQPFTKALVDVGMPNVLMLWQAAALFVLLIGCTNIVSLLLAQGAERQRELAVRMALGAARARVVRQLLIESLSSRSCPCRPRSVAWASLRDKTRCRRRCVHSGWDQMAVSIPLLLWTALRRCDWAIFGLLPAWQASRAGVLGAIKGGGDGGRSSTAGRGRNRTRRALVIAEVALALPLLVASALAVVGVQRFVTGAQGYDPHGVLRAGLVLPDPAYAKDDAMRQFADRVMVEVRRIPGVTSAAYATVLPASGSNRVRRFEIDGQPIDKERPLSVNFRNISTDYFQTLRIPVSAGRDFTAQDRDGAQRVAIISQSMATRYWPGRSPIGARVKLPTIGEDWLTVVGVSGDVIDDWFANRNVPTLYVPAAQLPTHYINLAIRTAGDPTTIESDLRAAVAAIDPQLPLFAVRTFPDALTERTTGLRFIGSLMAVFGAIALVLAAIGIYSVMSFYVTLRRNEFGVRLALGATPSNVLRMTMRHASVLAIIGVAIGLALSVALARLMEQAMFGTVSADPRILGIVAITLFAVAALSSFLPRAPRRRSTRRRRFRSEDST